jgi:uncharacterized protein YbjT (DUF2867 family)
MSTILVTGATGSIGSSVVHHLLNRHHRVRIYTHQSQPSVPQEVEVYQGDIRTGTGLSAAIKGADAVIHCASNPREEGHATDIQGTRHLVQMASYSDALHIIYISIVGIDRSEFAYYKTKLEVEHIIERSGLPWTTLRTTQFHDFGLNIITSAEAKNPDKIIIPAGIRFQSIDKDEVAQRLVDLAEQRPAKRVPDMGGPQILTIEEMTETYLRIFNKQGVIIQPESLQGGRYDAFLSGINLVPDHAVGRVTWEDFLRRSVEKSRYVHDHVPSY